MPYSNNSDIQKPVLFLSST